MLPRALVMVAKGLSDAAKGLSDAVLWVSLRACVCVCVCRWSHLILLGQLTDLLHVTLIGHDNQGLEHTHTHTKV